MLPQVGILSTILLCIGISCLSDAMVSIHYPENNEVPGSDVPLFGHSIDAYKDYIGSSSSGPTNEPHLPLKRSPFSNPEPAQNSQTSSASMPGQGRVVQLSALDCRHPTSVSSASIHDVRATRPQKHTVLSSHRVVLLQRVDETKRSAFRCSKSVSTFDSICGSFSHTKLMEPPSILQPFPVKENICETAAKTKLYVDETGKSHPLSGSSSVIYYKYLSRGSLTYSTNNVFCQGQKVHVAGEEHEGVVEMKTVVFTISPVEVVVRSDGRVQDTDNRLELPSVCRDSTSCISASSTYSFVSPPKLCPYHRIREVNVDLVEGHIAGKQRKLLVSNTTHVLIPIGDNSRTPPTPCLSGFGAFVPTDMDKLVVVFHEDIRNVKLIPSLSGSEVNLDMEDKLGDNYLFFALRKEMEASLLNLGGALCSVSEQAWTVSERSPFHPDQLIRRRGEVIQELTCRKVKVQTRVGSSIGSCYLDALPVSLGSEHLLLQASSRTLVERMELSRVPCNSINSPLFVTKEGVIVTADPVVKIIELELSHQQSPLIHALDLQDKSTGDQIFTELLYSPSEIESFTEYLSYQRIKEAASLQLIGDYCQKNPDCGSYNPSNDYSFDLEHLEDEISPFAFMSKWTKYVKSFGAYAGAIIAVFYVGNLLYQSFRMVRFRLQGFYWQDSWRMTRYPRAEVYRERVSDQVEMRARAEAVQSAPLLRPSLTSYSRNDADPPPPEYHLPTLKSKLDQARV